MQQLQQVNIKARLREENKVFVGGIHVEADEQLIRSTFEVFDEVLEVILMKDRETGKSRGFGFVTFGSQVGVQRSCAERDIRILNRPVEVKTAIPKGRITQTQQQGQSQPGQANDPYAAWAEYIKQYNPAYYQTVMQAYNYDQTAAMAAIAASYYSQYYQTAGADASAGATPEMNAMMQGMNGMPMAQPSVHATEEAKDGSVKSEGKGENSPERDPRSPGAHQASAAYDYSGYHQQMPSSMPVNYQKDELRRPSSDRRSSKDLHERDSRDHRGSRERSDRDRDRDGHSHRDRDYERERDYRRKRSRSRSPSKERGREREREREREGENSYRPSSRYHR